MRCGLQMGRSLRLCARHAACCTLFAPKGFPRAAHSAHSPAPNPPADDKPYQNPCFARKAGVEVQCRGGCPCPGEPPGWSRPARRQSRQFNLCAAIPSCFPIQACMPRCPRGKGLGSGAPMCTHSDPERSARAPGRPARQLCTRTCYLASHHLTPSLAPLTPNPPLADLLRALQRAPGGLLLVPTDDSLLAMLNATAPGDWMADNTFLRQLVARHTILAAGQPVRGPNRGCMWLGHTQGWAQSLSVLQGQGYSSPPTHARPRLAARRTNA